MKREFNAEIGPKDIFEIAYSIFRSTIITINVMEVNLYDVCIISKRANEMKDSKIRLAWLGERFSAHMNYCNTICETFVGHRFKSNTFKDFFQFIR